VDSVNESLELIASPPAVLAQDLCVSLGRRHLGPFNLVVDDGEMVSLVGENGSGKSSCIRGILGIYRSAGGAILVHGRSVSPSHPPRQVGYVPDKPEFWDWCNGSVNARTFATDDVAASTWLERFSLHSVAGIAVKKYSRGMRQRLAIVRALAAQPRLLVLDEPTIALDNDGVALLIEVLLERRQNGSTTLLASHDEQFLTGLDSRRVQLSNGRTLP
jgi:ABC-2 type transport system ATP-binding protein